MTGAFTSCVYEGTVIHRRCRPKRHNLKYKVFYLLIDLDELPALARTVRTFSYNGPGLFGFYDRDHGPGDGSPLRPWVERQLAQADIDLEGGPIRLLCYPRMLGYVFNPLSVYFCYRKERDNETLVAILYQVTNTFHERHSYLIPVDRNRGEPSEARIIRQSCPKEMYVSPFIEMDMTYNFRIKPPAEVISVAINETDIAGPLLHASFSGARRQFSTSRLLRVFIKYPLMTLKVIAGIHWEALQLWIKGVPVVRHPEPPEKPVSVIGDKEKIAA